MTFGLVTIPFKVYTAVSEQAVSFAMLHAECGTRVRSQLFCPAHNRVIEHAETVKGYEHTRDQYLALSREDLDALRHTGYMVGGCSPFGTKKALPVHLEKSILDLPLIYINGGKRGYLVGIHPHDILRVLHPKVVECGLAD